MSRTSPTHYIAPSAIGITPNANNSPNDLSVYVAENTKIRVYSPRAGIDMNIDGTFAEWALAGRNRRLSDSEKPYTIYARLPKNDTSNGYLVFVPQVLRGSKWLDKYPYITQDGFATDTAGESAGDNYYVRLGDATLPENDQRSVTLDTGILGTEQFNTEWALNPDALPLRIEMGCVIDDEDAGPTPYVAWGQQLVLTASLVEGWTGTDIKRFDHWEITRNTGNETADAAWNHPTGEGSYRGLTDNAITLTHSRGANDDFGSAVNALFTIIAMGTPEDDDSSGEVELVPLVTASINIMAETVEKYEMVFSAAIVSYDPRTQAYSPSGGVAVRFRATDQRGEVFMLTKKQYTDMGLVTEYAPVGSSSWQQLTPSGAAASEATVTVPEQAFHSQKSVNVRLKSAVGKELSNDTIAFVRDGEDSKEREWIFFRSTEAITFGTQEHPYPASISQGEVNPPSSRAAAGEDTNRNQDGWVPNTWWDEMQGTDATNRYEYGSYRDYDNANSRWGAFSEPKIWSHYGKDGDNAPYDELSYGRSTSRTSHDSNHLDTNYGDNGWGSTAPSVPYGDYLYIWQRTQHHNSAGAVTSTSYVCLTGEDGHQGIQGPGGDDAVNVVVSPASLIVNQSLQNPSNLDNLSEQFLISVLEGDTQKSVSKVEITSIDQDTSVSPARNKCTATGSNSYYAMLTAINKDADDQYYDQAYFICKVYYENNDKYVENVKVKIYANLLGTWKETVEEDTKTEVARSLTYGYDPESGEVIPLENFGQYIKSSEVNISTLTKQVGDGKNLLKGVLTATGWKSGTDYQHMTTDSAIDGNQWIKIGATGHTILKSPSFSIESGKTYTVSFETATTAAVRIQIRTVAGDNVKADVSTDSGDVFHKVGFTTPYSGPVYVLILTTKLRHPQVEVGSEATAFDASTSEVSSQIVQTAEGITETYNGFIPTKNMLKGALSGEGWGSFTAATYSGTTIRDAELGIDGFINTKDGDTYLHTSASLVSGKKYTLSFYSKKTDAITLTIFDKSTPSMYISFTVPAASPATADTRRVLTFQLSAPLSSGNLGISLNTTSIRYPQLEEGETATDFIADTVEMSSQITKTATEFSAMIGDTGIDITNKLIKLIADKTTFLTTAGVPMIAVQMCDANGNVGTGPGYSIPSIVFYNGEIGAQGVTVQWVLNYLGFIQATNAGVRFSFTTKYDVYSFVTFNSSKQKYEHTGITDGDESINPDRMAEYCFFNTFIVETLNLFNCGYYINQQGAKVYQPAQGKHYEMYNNIEDIRRYWLTDAVDSNFTPDASANNTASEFYFMPKHPEISNYYAGRWPTIDDWKDYVPVANNRGAGDTVGDTPIRVIEAAKVFDLVYFELWPEDSQTNEKDPMSATNPAGIMRVWENAFVVFYKGSPNGLEKTCIGLIGGNKDSGNNPTFVKTYCSPNNIINEYNM